MNAAQIYVRLQLALKQGALEYDDGPLRQQLAELMTFLPPSWAEILAVASSGTSPLATDEGDTAG